MPHSFVVNVADGFEIEEPAVFVPWGVTEDGSLQVLPATPRHVTSGYYVIACTSLGGLQHQLGFHFRPRQGRRLAELELFHTDARDLNGSPTTEEVGDADLAAYGWTLGPTRVRHYVFERFGPEEHVRIEHA